MHEEHKNMTVAIIAVVLVIVVGIAIFLIAGNNSKATDDSKNPPPVSAVASNKSKTFTLTAQSDSMQNGTVTLMENGTTTKVTINLTNPSTTPEPAHIHLGSCPTPGDVKYALTNIIEGTSVTNINVKYEDLKSLEPIAVNVHKSADEIGTYISCGDLMF